MRLMWLGFIFLIAVFLFAAGILLVQNFSFFSTPTTLVVDFADANRLRKGDDVLVEGIPYGKVAGVELRPDRVRITCVLDADVRLFGDPEKAEGYRIYVESFSILG